MVVVTKVTRLMYAEHQSKPNKDAYSDKLEHPLSMTRALTIAHFIYSTHLSKRFLCVDTD